LTPPHRSSGRLTNITPSPPPRRDRHEREQGGAAPVAAGLAAAAATAAVVRDAHAEAVARAVVAVARHPAVERACVRAQIAVLADRETRVPGAARAPPAGIGPAAAGSGTADHRADDPVTLDARRLRADPAARDPEDEVLVGVIAVGIARD